MAADVAVSMSLLSGIVALSHVTRRMSIKALADTGLSVYVVELVSTFQLCCCTHELKLLSEVGGIQCGGALTLTYLASIGHGLTETPPAPWKTPTTKGFRARAPYGG